MSKWWLLGLIAIVSGCTAPSDVIGGDEENDGEEIAETTEQGWHATTVRAGLYATRPVFGGEETTLELRVRNGAGQPITSFENVHTKKADLVIASHDLSYFARVQPTYVGGGRFRIDWTPPNVEDDYVFYAQYRPSGVADVVTSRFRTHVTAMGLKAIVPVTEDTAPVTSGTSKLALTNATAGHRVGPQNVFFSVTNTATNRPATLGTFLGARAHVVAIKAESQASVLVRSVDARTSYAPGELVFDMDFPSTGLYRVWVQYRQGNRDVTQFMTVKVGSGSAPSTCNYDQLGRSYTARSADECSRINFMCAPGFTQFSDACGCGCAAN